MYTEGIVYDPKVDITFLIIMILSSVGLVLKENQPYSLNKIFYLFSFFFFGVAPFLQYKQGGVTFFGSSPLSFADNFHTNFIIISILIGYFFLYRYFFNKSNNGKWTRLAKNNKVRYVERSGHHLIVVVLSLSAFFVMFAINGFNLISLLVRGGELIDRYEFSSSAIRLLTNRFFQPMMIICLLFYLQVKTKKKFIIGILFVIALIGSSPTGMSRFSAAALYIPLIILTVPFIRRKNNFILALTGGLLLFFPYLAKFRYFSLDTDFTLSPDYDTFTSGAYDSYQHFATVMNHDIVTNGQQLFGVIFFWVPRNYWGSKPIGSGAMLADHLGYYFSNISLNYFGEGYINFGYIGILIFLVVFSYITAKLDKAYWTVKQDSFNPFQVIYLLLLGLTFFILRGDLLSSVAYTIGFVISALFVSRFLFRKETIQSRSTIKS